MITRDTDPTSSDSTSSVQAIDIYIGEQVTEERDRKKSLESRAITVITTSGAFATAAFAIGTFALPGGAATSLSQLAQALLVAALAAFAIAALLGVLANRPLGYSEPSAEELEKALGRANKKQVLSDALNDVADSRLKTLAKARKLNKHKACLLGAALTAQAVAFVLIAGAVWDTVVS